MAKQTTTFNSVVTAFFAALVLLAAPATAQTETLDRLFEELEGAEPMVARRIESQIQTEWDKSGSAAMDLLLRRGKDALDNGEPEQAVEHFTAAIDHAPDFAEGYHGRATAYYLTGRIGPALDDLRMTLRLNPRHFSALRGLAIILEELDRPNDALDVYRMVIEINPHAPGVTEAVDRLEIELQGQTL